MPQAETKSTSGGVFVDTNVLLYARDRKAHDKRAKAQTWLAALAETGRARINLQVINEYTRWVLANEPGRPLKEVRAEYELLRKWGDKPLGDDEVELAWAVRERLGYQWFDCLLIAAARVAGCTYFLTEDMGKGARFDAVTLVHLFDTSPAELLGRN
jgi:predicted nucleic acid-binding protein